MQKAAARAIRENAEDPELVAARTLVEDAFERARDWRGGPYPLEEPAVDAAFHRLSEARADELPARLARARDAIRTAVDAVAALGSDAGELLPDPFVEGDMADWLHTSQAVVAEAKLSERKPPQRAGEALRPLVVWGAAAWLHHFDEMPKAAPTSPFVTAVRAAVEALNLPHRASDKTLRDILADSEWDIRSYAGLLSLPPYPRRLK